MTPDPKPMKAARISSPLRVITPGLSAVLLGFLTSAPGLAQTPPPPAATVPAKPQVSAEEAVQLSPFEVAADHDDSYGALNSNSITRFNTELSKMPVSADIFTQALERVADERGARRLGLSESSSRGGVDVAR